MFTRQASETTSTKEMVTLISYSFPLLLKLKPLCIISFVVIVY